jgi:hypothetical protein
MVMQDRGYSQGWRYGVFDKCNGKVYNAREAHFSEGEAPDAFSVGFQAGYTDAYESNQAMIGEINTKPLELEITQDAYVAFGDEHSVSDIIDYLLTQCDSDTIITLVLGKQK